jgi:hypothetical protein
MKLGRNVDRILQRIAVGDPGAIKPRAGVAAHRSTVLRDKEGKAGLLVGIANTKYGSE